MTYVKQIYKVLRSILFVAVSVVAGLYVAVYLLLSVPYVHDRIRDTVEHEVSGILGTDVSIGHLFFAPFNSLLLEDVAVPAPDGTECISIAHVGAGINLWKLIAYQKIEITYAELIGLDAHISQPAENAPYNIDFLIKAFAPKDRRKPPARFDLRLHGVVIRKSSVAFDRQWQPEYPAGRFNPNHISLREVKADVSIPRLKNDRYEIDLRRLAFAEQSGLVLDRLSLYALLTPDSLSVRDMEIVMPGTSLRPEDISLSINGFDNILRALEYGGIRIRMIEDKITPSDFAPFFAPLAAFDMPLSLSVDLTGSSSDVNIGRFGLTAPNDRLHLNMSGSADFSPSGTGLTVDVNRLDLSVKRDMVDKIVRHIPGIPAVAQEIAGRCGDVAVAVSGSYTGGLAAARGRVLTDLCDADIDASALRTQEGIYNIKGNVECRRLLLGVLANDERFGETAFVCDAELTLANGVSDGRGTVSAEYFDWNGNRFTAIGVTASKSGGDIKVTAEADDRLAMGAVDLHVVLDGKESILTANADIDAFVPSAFGLLSSYPGYELSGHIDVDTKGNNMDNLTGSVNMSDIGFAGRDGRSLHLDTFSLTSSVDGQDKKRRLTVDSDWLFGRAAGNFTPSCIPVAVRNILACALPGIVSPAGSETPEDFSLAYGFVIPANDAWPRFFGFPLGIVTDISLHGEADGSCVSLSAATDYLLKGRDKLIRNPRVDVRLDGAGRNGVLNLSTYWPVKNSEVKVAADLMCREGNLLATVAWNPGETSRDHGSITAAASLCRDRMAATPQVDIDLHRSQFTINGEEWNVSPAKLSYADRAVEVRELNVSHGTQFLTVEGRASASDTDTLRARLSDIDLGYIFRTLNINHVTFGGRASGGVIATSLFSGAPKAYTTGLEAESFSYNDAVLGEHAELSGEWRHTDKSVRIGALISDGSKRRATVDGGVWVTRDSLDFTFDTDSVNIAFLKPFMSAFCSELEGRASGRAHLYGTFSDVNLTGRLHADTIRMKVDYTDVAYSGSDSVRITPGRIEIPQMRLYDDEGHSALFWGLLTHNFFHDAAFEFRAYGARSLLGLDTRKTADRDWYGRVYVNGNVLIKGRPGYVGLDVNATTAPNTAFTFELTDMEAAEDYGFLTFSDRRREAEEAASRRDTVPDIVTALRRKILDRISPPSVFALDMRVTVTPQATLNLVMDPVAGDKIVARGSGPLRVTYDSESDEMEMYGKYTIAEGKYNFSLQDVILKDFTIREGSGISFNGDPMAATLGITALYRVNTNLTDLDKSFATDRDLNRTNVPVNAVLNVHGPLQSPDISFDIEFPTLTSDVTRKVRSIISTDEMMHQQIIYLLALNRFYTPEYVNGGSGGAELASVASSTISSQLANIIGQMSDKFTLAPSFRSDKGDFSDTEFDVALSSRLLNNRLLLNGNFGYRDRNTSNTTFVGDFEMEYLLNRSGNLRLKAYNHFNDQNYYLRQALTTQGIGIVYRRDFDDPFTFLRPRRPRVLMPADSVSPARAQDTLKIGRQ